MADSVIDTSVVSMANGQIAGRRRGNALDRRLSAIEDVAYGRRRIRYNPNPLVEYQRIVPHLPERRHRALLYCPNRTGSSRPP
jgi:hypothetical protein